MPSTKRLQAMSSGKLDAVAQAEQEMIDGDRKRESDVLKVTLRQNCRVMARGLLGQRKL